LTPLGAYVRERLHRRIFVWFGLTILLTVVISSLVVMVATGGRIPNWTRERQQAAAFFGEEFAHAWDNPAERDRLAKALGDAFEVDLEIKDTEGNRVAAAGDPCHGPEWVFPINRDGKPIGAVHFCGVPSLSLSVHVAKAVLGLVVAGVLLWGGSGIIAWRLAYPIEQVARMAEAIGAGKFSTRVRLRRGRRFHGEVAALATSINTMAERIEKQFQGQRELLAAVSHEIKTPLARIRLLLELIREKGTDDPMMTEIDREVVEMDALVGDLLATSRLDFATVTPSKLDATEVARRALDRAGVPPSALVVETDDPWFEGDATLVARALANLIQNANRHGGGLTTLRVSARGDGIDRRVVFEAEDCGPGFEPGEEDRVFDPFFRGARCDSSAGGASGEVRHVSLGLGLSLVRRIAEAHDGRAYACARRGGGACVGVELAGRPLCVDVPKGELAPA
jgi:signal transduction histidine kinase